MNKPVNFNPNDVYIDMGRKGCKWCMTYNWKTHKEVPSDFSSKTPLKISILSDSFRAVTEAFACPPALCPGLRLSSAA